ncbi:hypothetical protein [Nocardioides sp.]|uniref:hypothetical protein n=1 Tax=Nocardioides sp. TaxID=35761 RepID=UPI002B269BF7|nr:hypothetical protein [Nocardioides sp.]
MGSDEDDHTLFTLADPEPAPPVERTTLVRQGSAAAALLALAALTAYVLPATLGSDDPSAAPSLLALGVIVLVPLTLALTGLVLVVAVATALVQARVSASA